ncbi:MAG: DUF697 domain-containing protein [Spirochaetota bacterium]
MENQEETLEKSDPKDEISPGSIIHRHMLYSMAAGAIPIPYVDIAAVTANQLDMIRQLAIYYSVEYNNDLGKSIASSITGATLAKAGASSIKALPGVGTWLGITAQVVLAGASTYALGQIFKIHFSQDKGLFDINTDDMKQKYQDYLGKGKQAVIGVKKKFIKGNDLKSLGKLYELKESGAISDDEYESTKKSVLDKVAQLQA